MDTTPHALLMRALRGESTPRPPLWLMRQAGRCDPEYRRIRADSPHPLEILFQTPELAAQISLLPLRWGVDAVIIFQDILTPLSGMGAPFLFRPGPKPKTPMNELADLEQLHLFDMAEALPWVAQTFALLRDNVQTRYPLLGFAGAPFTLLAFLAENGSPPLELPRTRRLMTEYPKETRRILTLLAEMTAHYLRYQISAGADAVQLFESVAHCLNPEEYAEWALPWQQQVFSHLDAGDTPTIFFARREDALLPPATLRAAGAHALSLPAAYSLAAARDELDDNTPLQGNLDNRLLAEGKLEDILAAAKRCIEEGACRGHIFNLGHGVLPHTPFENVQALVEYVRGFRV